MAIVAGVATVDVCRVFTCCYDTIVAAVTSSEHLGVIDRKYRHPNIRGMAVFADVAGQNVGRVLACGIRPVMTTETVPGDICVVKIGRQPSCGGMAIVAGVSTADVCWMFSDCYSTVVAAFTSSENLGVIDRECRCPDVGCVAVLANVCRQYVSVRFAGRVGTVVAIEAIVAYVGMIKICRYPCDG
jgi:hypothetical protein